MRVLRGFNVFDFSIADLTSGKMKGKCRRRQMLLVYRMYGTFLIDFYENYSTRTGGHHHDNNW